MNGRYIYAASSDMAMGKMYAYPTSQHVLSHWKFVLYCCANCPCIDLPDQESDMHHSRKYISICFHIYH